MNITSIFSLLFALLIRWIVSLHPYSGEGTPPMYGDYEAQRHWMEITVNQPVDQWYTNSSNNDLSYWGLDYPPLTAYHSYLMGKIAQRINPGWVELYKSRGFESYHHKLFMRTTGCPTIIALFYFWLKLEESDLGSRYFLRSLIIPSFILIDYGHFQYNCVTLGLFLWTMIFLQHHLDFLAAILFCLALNYKQIAFYYSLPIFFFLLKRCFQKTKWRSIILKFIELSAAVLITFGILWFPYLRSLDSTIQVFRRIFPLDRGIYEDKVANFWYSISPFIKVKNIFNGKQLAYLSALLTLVASLPSCYIVFRQNTLRQLKYSLFTISMAFFLFSFQVHEKTILFSNMAMILMSDSHPFLAFWFSIISTFSLQPLLIKDKLSIPYFALLMIYSTICQDTFLRFKNNMNKRMFLTSMIGVILLSFCALVLPASSRYPHIHSLLNCVYSFVHFFGFYAFFLREQLLVYMKESRGLYNIHTMTYIRPRLKMKIQ